MLYSIGKDSSVLLRLAQKAFHPGPIPFPLLHIDTTYKFREMIEFRDRIPTEIGARLIVHTNDEAIADGTQPFIGRHAALLRAAQDQVAARRARGRQATTPRSAARAARRGAIARARSGSSRCATRSGQWDPKNQRPELWHLLNGRVRPGRKHPRVPAVQLDRARRLATTSSVENIPDRPALLRAGARGHRPRRTRCSCSNSRSCRCMPGEKPQRVMCRMRSLGCSPCTGAVRSDADTVAKIIAELIAAKHSERQLRVIDHDQDGSMELKKREGYF